MPYLLHLPRVGERKTESAHPFNPYAFDKNFGENFFFQGEVIAMDKIANKVKKIKQNAELLQLNCIKAFCYDGTRALSVEKREDKQGKINNLASSSFEKKILMFSKTVLNLSQVYKSLKSWQIPKLLQHCECTFIFYSFVIISFCMKQIQKSNYLSLSLPNVLKGNAFLSQMILKTEETFFHDHI